MIARSTLLCCSMRLKYCCTNSTQLSSCRSMARWTAAMVVSSIWNLALCAAAYGVQANNATPAAIHSQRGFLLMISSPRVTGVAYTMSSCDTDHTLSTWCCGGYVSGDLRPIGSSIRNPACRPEGADADCD